MRMMSEKGDNRRRFRTPLGLTIIGYKALLGIVESGLGALLLLPRVNITELFRRLTAHELREDSTDRFVALAVRHLPSLVQHRYLVGAGLLGVGIAKLVAAGAMWEGKEWGPYVIGGVVGLLLPFDLWQAISRPTVASILLAAANALVLAAVVRLLHLGEKPRTGSGG